MRLINFITIMVNKSLKNGEFSLMAELQLVVLTVGVQFP